MRQWNGQVLVQAMACRLVGTKQLTETKTELSPIEPSEMNFR